MSFFDNTCKPNGIGGRIMVFIMNVFHRPMADWGFQVLEIPPKAMALDCGCGGGANIKRMLRRYPTIQAMGIDYSKVSVESAKKVNQKYMAAGRCEIFQASVGKLPFQENQFDLVTAFETIYFWPDLEKDFREIFRVLKSGGTFFICNECNGDTEKDDKWTEIVDGMTIWKDTEIKSALTKAGFHRIQIRKNHRGWISIKAAKL